MYKYQGFLAQNIQKKLDFLERRPAWLAKKAQISPSLLSRIFAGNGNPGIDTVVKIAKAMDMDPAALLIDPLLEVSSASEIFSLLSTQSPDRRALILALLHDDPSFAIGNPLILRLYEELSKVR